MNRSNRILIIYLLAVLFSCSSNEMSKKEAVRSLKVLNSDIVNFGTQAAESIEYKTLDFILDQPTAPFPFCKNSDGFLFVKTFQSEAAKGVYSWEETNGNFKKIDESRFVDLQFNLKEFENVAFRLTDYKSVVTSSGQPFPTLIRAEIIHENEKVWSLDYEAVITDGLPETIQLNAEAKNYTLSGQLARTRSDEEGTLMAKVDFNYLTRKILETRFNANIGYSRQGYYFNQLEFQQKLFNHFIDGFCDYAKVNPTANDYAASFNKNTDIEVCEDKNKKVGKVTLATVENNELFDFHIKFPDSSEELVGKHIPLFDKLLNFKY